jgi:hypothetical protein
MRIGMMAVVCPSCGQVSPEDVDRCPNCAEPLSTVGRVFHRHEVAGGPPPWLQRNRDQAQQVKMEALAQSEARMQEFLQIEQAHISSVRQAEREQREKDRRLLYSGLAIAAVILLAVLVLAALAAFLP